MQNSWASSLDLHVELESGGGRRDAVERAVQAAIRSGRLRPGDRLPSTRALAHDLGLARGTVADAYAQLAVEGYLSTSPGAPTRVAAGPAAHDGASSSGVAVATTPRGFDLRVGLPDLALPARGVAARHAPRGCRRPRSRARRWRPARTPELRAALAAYLGRTRGVLADPERIVVCSGYTQGLAILCGALRSSGVRAIAMEDPCLHHQRAIAAAAGLAIRPLAVDDEGASDEVPAGAGGAVVTPAHQFPLGPTLAPARRSGLVAWARSAGAFVVEDDYDGEFRYDRQPPGALQGLDPEHVVYAGTVSKTLTPGLRIGSLQLPRRLLAPVIDAKTVAGDTQALDQLALAELLTSGAYDRHVRRMRQRYRRRRDQLLDLSRHPRSRAPHPRGRRRVARGARRAGRGRPGGARRRALTRAQRPRPVLARAARGPSGVVLGYAAPPEHAYGRTLVTLADALRASGAAG